MPKMVEIDETQLIAQQNVVALVNKALANPKTRSAMQKIAREVNPDASVPELDAKEEVLSVVEQERAARLALEKRLDDEKAEREAEKQANAFKAQWDSKKDRLRAEGWLDEGIEKVEAFAQERGIADLEAAAAYYEKLNPPADPVMPSGIGGFDVFNPESHDTDEMKKLIESRGDDSMTLNAMVNKALGDVRSPGRR